MKQATINEGNGLAICERLRLEANALDALRLRDAPSTCREAAATIEALVEALQGCANKFWEYVIIHEGKKTPDGDEKAARNREMAEMCEAALAKSRPVEGDEVERVARAIYRDKCNRHYGIAFERDEWENAHEWQRNEALNAARAAIAALPPAVGWQPIESAPKDGKLVVLWQRGHGLHVARWSEAFEDWHGTDWEHTPALDPTHWMRPEPPAQPPKSGDE